jgi:hypothetical protein
MALSRAPRHNLKKFPFPDAASRHRPDVRLRLAVASVTSRLQTRAKL